MDSGLTGKRAFALPKKVIQNANAVLESETGFFELDLHMSSTCAYRRGTRVDLTSLSPRRSRAPRAIRLKMPKLQLQIKLKCYIIF